MTEATLTELLAIRNGLEVKMSLLADAYLYGRFRQEWERLNRLIEQLQNQKMAVPFGGE